MNVTVWHEKKYKEAIYLLSNLHYPPLITQLYKKRFKPGRRAIETFFSDQKSRGFNLQRSHLSEPERLAKLLIVTCLAYILCILAGVSGRRAVANNPTCMLWYTAELIAVI